MELTETHSNYKIILDYVKNYKPSLDENQIDPKITDLSYNPDSVIKTITQKQKTLSEAETRTIITKYQQGKSTYELAKEFGCHRYTISKALKDNGIEVTNQCAKKKVLAEMIMQMYSEWYKPQEIGEHLAQTILKLGFNEFQITISKQWNEVINFLNTLIPPLELKQ